MTEDVAAKIAHHALAEQRRENRLAVLAGEADDERSGEDQRRAPHERRRVGRERDVDDALRHQRTDELHESVDDQTRQRGHHQHRIRPRIDEKPPHEARVERLTGHFLVVHIGNVVARATCSSAERVREPDVVRALRG